MALLPWMSSLPQNSVMHVACNWRNTSRVSVVASESGDAGCGSRQPKSKLSVTNWGVLAPGTFFIPPAQAHRQSAVVSELDLWPLCGRQSVLPLLGSTSSHRFTRPPGFAFSSASCGSPPRFEKPGLPLSQRGRAMGRSVSLALLALRARCIET